MFLDKVVSSFLRFPGRNAFCIQGNYHTYAELAARVTAIRNVLAESYAGEQRFGVWLHDDLETYAAIVALLLSGKTYIPIHPGHPAGRIAQIVSQSALRYVLCSRPAGLEGVLPIDTAGLAGAETAGVAAPACPPGDGDAYILFTSGSTGTPKGVPISYDNLNGFVEAFFALGYNVSEEDRFLQMFDLTFDLSVMSYLIPLCIGGCVCTVPDAGIKYLNVCNVLEEQGVTFALMVPSILASLRPYFSEVELPVLRYSLFCGEALYTELAGEWMRCAPNAIVENVYGPTEATIFCLTYRVPRSQPVEDNNGIVTIGMPMEGMEAIVVNEANEPVAEGAKGELCLSGRQVTRGYLNPEKNNVFFELGGKRYYRTGDIACKSATGNFIYCGRADHQVKIQGYRVELSEIEYHLRAVTCNANAVALTHSSGPAGLMQIDVVLEGAAQDTAEIAALLAEKLPVYMMPAAFHFVSVFPLNSSGKTDRNELKKWVLSQAK